MLIKQFDLLITFFTYLSKISTQPPHFLYFLALQVIHNFRKDTLGVLTHVLHSYVIIWPGYLNSMQHYVVPLPISWMLWRLSHKLFHISRLHVLSVHSLWSVLAYWNPIFLKKDDVLPSHHKRRLYTFLHIISLPLTSFLLSVFILTFLRSAATCHLSLFGEPTSSKLLRGAHHCYIEVWGTPTQHSMLLKLQHHATICPIRIEIASFSS